MTLFEDGVVVVVENNPDVRHTADTMINDVDAFRQLTDNRAMPVLWDVRSMSRPTPYAWRAFLDEVADALSALAILVDERSRMVTGGFPAVMDAFLFPSRLFEDRDEAYEWLLQHVPEDYATDDHAAGTAANTGEQPEIAGED